MDAFSARTADGQVVANMITEILTDLAGYHDDVESLRQNWIFDTLVAIGFEEDLIRDMSDSDLFDFLIRSGVEISYYPRFGGSDIKLDGELVGEWAGPEFSVEFDEKNKPYYRITIEHWTHEQEE